MPRKLTIEEVRERASKRGLTLLDDVYINKKTPMTFMDNDGYKYYLSIDCVCDKRTKRFQIVSKNNIYTIENIQKFIENNGSKSKLITENFEDIYKKLKIKCECGEIFELSWIHMWNAKKITCNKCGRKRIEESHRHDYSWVISQVGNVGYKLLTKEEEFKNLHTINVEDSDGYRYNTSLYNLKDNKNIFTKFSKKNIFLIHNICNYININNLPIELVDKTPRQIGVKNGLFEFYCCECGEIYSTTLDQIRYEHKFRCGKCSKKQSTIEWMVEQYLILKNVKYEKEKRFNNCRNKNPLPFDFYLVDYNTVLEIQGYQHYYENHYFNQQLGERKRIDEIKKKYCENNNINYIAIPYWLILNNGEKEAYKNIIDKILK